MGGEKVAGSLRNMNWVSLLLFATFFQSEVRSSFLLRVVYGIDGENVDRLLEWREYIKPPWAAV